MYLKLDLAFHQKKQVISTVRIVNFGICLTGIWAEVPNQSQIYLTKIVHLLMQL